MSSTTDGGGGVRVPTYIWHVLVLALLGGTVTVIASHVGDNLEENTKVNNNQAVILTNHEARLGSLERGQEKVDSKLETIIGRLPPAK